MKTERTLTLPQIQHALAKVNLAIVHAETGISKSTLQRLRTDSESGFTYATIYKVSRYLIAEANQMIKTLEIHPREETNGK